MGKKVCWLTILHKLLAIFFKIIPEPVKIINCTFVYCSMIRYLSITVLIVCMSLAGAFSQEQKYQFVHFEELFKPGIYLSFEAFKAQQPIPEHAIIAMEKKDDPQFLLKVLSYERFSYFDSTGNRRTLKSEDIWGLVRRNSLYIFHEYALSKVHFNGRWGYFTTYKISLQPGMGVMPGSHLAVQVPLTAGKRTQTMIIDLKTGNIQPFKRKDFLNILSADSLLKNEYQSLRRRKQKQLKYLYLRKLNDRTEFTYPK